MIGFELTEIEASYLLTGAQVFLQTQSATPVPVVVWAPKLTYSNQYSATAQRLTSAELFTGDAVNIAEAFDGLPGVQIQQGALNTQRLSLRGIGARTPFATNQLRLYWNDIPLTNGVGESVLEDIESGFLRTAYVQTGPAPAHLGANLGGSIQLVSREWQSKNWGSAFGGSVGSFGRNRQWFNLHNSSSDKKNDLNKWEQDVSLVRSHSNGYRDNNIYDRVSGTVLGRVEHRRANTFYLLHLRQMDAEIPSSLNAIDLVEKPEAAAFTWAAVNGREDQLTYLAGVQHFRQMGQLGAARNNLTNRTALFAGRRTNDEVRPFNVIEEDSYQYGLRTKFSIDKYRGFFLGEIDLGGELFWEDYDQQLFQTLDGGVQGSSIGGRTENHFYYFAFAQWNRRWQERWRTEASINIRASQYQLQTTIERDFKFDPFYLPGFTLFFEASDALHLHARFNRGISQPDVAAAVENSLTNAEPLLPSYGWNKELGIQWQKGSVNGRLTAFRMDVEDALVVRMDELGVPFFFNGGSAIHQGLEAQFSYSWPTSDKSRLLLRSNYTLAAYRFKDFVDDQNDFSDNRIPGVPQHRWQNRLSWQGQRIRISATLDMADEQFVDDANTTTADGYTLLHCRIAYDLIASGKVLQIYAGINNLLDEAYVSMVQVNATGFGGALPRSYYPGQPRYFYFGVNYGLDYK
jgi:iron complex outermembrane receptor protein